MTIQQLIYAITVSETGSLNKAAEKLYVSQPSLTEAVRELEKECGITIFTRSAKGMTLTPDGAEFILYARQTVNQYNELVEHYGSGGAVKKKFGVTCQHYSFAVKAFVEMVKSYDTAEYEFAIREARTGDVISDVASMRSEIGILFLSDYNRSAIEKILRANDLEFKHLIRCKAYVYIARSHPLARRKKITFEDLAPYPCLSFEQGDEASFYYAEEILSTKDYPRMIKANDRATMLNLMVGLNGYTLCSGIICEELNGDQFVAVPFVLEEEDKVAGIMEIGYITRRNTVLSGCGRLYIEKVNEYLKGEE
ncbi:MAG: LysR family transcriptional regulator [Clostridiales bacterium]|nr:LysR family transcriptional regulator [Clostridiales bacterium]